MGIWPDHRIAANSHIIEPFKHQSPSGVVSYGLTSYGYDFRLGFDFVRLMPRGKKHRGVLDPKVKLSPKEFEALYPSQHREEPFLLQPSTVILGQSLEYFRIPRECLAIIQGKSSYARLGLIVNCTPFEPEWEGFATVCLINNGELPIRLYPGEGIAQITFHSSDDDTPCGISYKDKKGRYDGAQGIQMSKE